MKTTTPTDFKHLATAERQPASAHISTAQARANEAAFHASLDTQEAAAPQPFSLTVDTVRQTLTAGTTTPIMELAQALATAITNDPGRVVLVREFVLLVLVRAAYHWDSDTVQLLVQAPDGSQHWDSLSVGDAVTTMQPETERILAEMAAVATQRTRDTQSLLNPGERLVRGGFELDGYKLSYSHSLTGANEKAQRWASKKTMWPDVVMYQGVLHTVAKA